MATVTIKQEKEIIHLKLEVDELKYNIKQMEEQMISFMTKLQETSDKQAHAGVIKAVESPKSSDDSLVEEDTQKGESWIHCQACDHKCETKKSMKNHPKTKHNNIKFCEKCSESFL